MTSAFASLAGTNLVRREMSSAFASLLSFVLLSAAAASAVSSPAGAHHLVRTELSAHHATPLAELPPIGVVWHVPIGCDPTGFFFEALAYAVEFEKRGVPVCLNCGKCSEQSGSHTLLHEYDKAAVKRVQDACDKPLQARHIVTVHHQKVCDSKDSGLVPWYRNDNGTALVIVRTMTETSLPPLSEIACLKSRRVDEVWLPSRWHADLFEHAGAPPSKIAVVPEATPLHTFFPGPSTSTSPITGLLDLFGSNASTRSKAAKAVLDDETNSGSLFVPDQRKAAEAFFKRAQAGRKPFVFVSVFKVSTGSGFFLNRIY